MKRLLCIFIACSSILMAQGLDDSFKINEAAIVVEKLKLSVIAENIANAATFEVAGKDEPYRKKYVVLKEANFGPEATAVAESKADFPIVYEPASPYADDDGYIRMPNLNLPDEMVNLSLTEVRFQSNLNALKTTKSLYQVVIEALK